MAWVYNDWFNFKSRRNNNKNFFSRKVEKQFPFYDILKVTVHEVTDYENSNLFNCSARLFRCSICTTTTIFC